jgi:hypothetical protein
MKGFPVGTWITDGTDARRVDRAYLLWGEQWNEMLNPPDLTPKPTTFYAKDKEFSTKADAEEYTRLYYAYTKAYDAAYKAQRTLKQFAAEKAVKE